MAGKFLRGEHSKLTSDREWRPGAVGAGADDHQSHVGAHYL